MGSGMIDWRFAVNVAGRLAGDGPEVSRDEAAAVVAELRADAHRSTGLVQDFTGLIAPPDTAPVLVVDRRGWVQANADAFAEILAPIVDKVSEKRAPTGLMLAVGSKVTGAEVGGLMGFLSGKVLGQFDPFSPPAGRLLLVAPNIVHVERELGVDPTDFRLWVCLHEETHRVQFTANPWLRDHLFTQMNELADQLDVGSFLDGGIKRIADSLRSAREGGGSLIDVLSTPAQREVLDRVTGVMSLLEGHADVVMDGVGPTVIPSVSAIRAKFTQRRQGVGTLDRLLRRVLGLDAKMAQYRDGAVFVRHVVDKVGMEDFNAVWTSPETLPSLAEIHDPALWVQRVLT
jgi:coenzyme F420 biosynthesis associated uncharacterized protein